MAVINLDYKPGGALNPLDASGEPTVRRVDINAHLIVRETGPDGALVFGGTLQGRLGQPVSQGDDWIFSAPAEAFVEFGYGNNTLTFGHGTSPSPTWAGLNHVPSMGFFSTTFGTDTVKVPWGVHLDLMAGGIGRFDRLEFDAASPAGQLTVATLRVEELIDRTQMPATLGPMPRVFGSPGIDRLELDSGRYHPGAAPTLQLNLKPLVLDGFDAGPGTRLPYFDLDAPGPSPLPGSNSVPTNLPDHLALVGFQGQVEAHLTVPIHVVSLGAATVTGSLRGDLIDASGGGPLNAGGLAGDDTFVPSPQADAINGGTDFDTVIYRGAPAIVDLARGATQGQPPGAAAGDTLVSIEAVWGSDLPDSPGGGGNYRGDSLWGDAHDNLLDGRAGNDTLGGFSGNDTLIGGPGYDVAQFAGERLLYAVQPGIALGSGGPTSDLVLVGTGPMAGQGQDAVAGVELFEFLDEPGQYHTLAQLQGRQGLFTDSTVVLDYGVGGTLNPVDGSGIPRVNALSLNIRDDNVYEMDRFGQIVGGGEIDDILARPNLGAAERYGLVLPPSGTVLMGPGADMVVAQGSSSLPLGSSPVFVDGLGGEDAIGGTAGRTTAYVAGNLQNFEVVRFDPAAAAAAVTTIAFDLSDGAVPNWRVDGSTGKDILRFNVSPASAGGQVIDLALRNLSWADAQQGSRAGDIDFVHVVATTVADPLFVNVPDGLPVLVQSGSGSDVLQGADGGDVFAAGGGNDSLYGERGDDVLLGEAGDDLLRGGEGDDLIDGGPGIDVAVFNGPRSAFEVLPPTPQWGGTMPDLVLRDTRAIFAPDGTDGLVSIERFRFFDGTYTLAQLLAPQPSIVALASATVPSVPEGDSVATAGVLTFQVARSGNLSIPSTVTFTVEGGAGGTTSDDIATVTVGGTVLGSGFGMYTVNLAAGLESATIDIAANADRITEADEAVVLTLLSASGGASVQPDARVATGLIVNDDAPNQPPIAHDDVLNVPVRYGTLEVFIPFVQLMVNDVDPEGMALSVVAVAGGTGAQVDEDNGNVRLRDITHPVVSFNYDLRDAAGAVDTASVTVNLQFVPNSAPVLGADGPVSLRPGQTASIVGANLLGNDTDADGDSLSIMQFFGSTAQGGTVQNTAFDTFTYTPPENFLGTDTFTYVVTDGFGGFAQGALSLIVKNSVPVFVADSALALRPGQTATIVGASLLSNDTDADGDALSITQFFANTAQGGSVQNTAFDTFTYTPPADFIGTDTFSYVVSDGFGGRAAATLSLQVGVSPIRPPLLSGAPEVVEGQPWGLTVSPQATGTGALSLQYRVDWGDGLASQTLSGAELAALGGVLTHVFADDVDGPMNRDRRTVQVTVTDPAMQQAATARTGVDVVDVAPVLTSFGLASTVVEHGTATVLNLGRVSDVAGDPVQQLLIVWGDGSSQPVAPGGPVSHRFDGLGSFEVKATVVNDDGTFEVARTAVATSATAGGATPNGTPAQWAAAWTDSLMSFSHKANGDNGAEAWTPVTLSAVNSGALAGGDVYGGLLGVSGQSAATSTVRQEIDGREALRVSLTGGERADTLIVDLARLFLNDAPGVREAAVLQLYDGSALVRTVALQAANANGKLHVELFDLPLFSDVVFRAGTLDEDAGGVLRPGGLVDSQGGYVPATATLGSDYLVESVQFLDLPDVGLTGMATGGAMGIGG